MAKPRELRRRIKSVQSTRKITKTMELVATSKLKRAQDRVIAARPYAAALADVIGDLYAPELAERFPLLRQPGVTDPGRKPGDPAGVSGVSSVRARAGNYILKPSAEAILEQLLPLYVRNQVYRALVETAAAFLGAQRTAMKNATDNAGEMLDLLQRTFNRARQAQITQELAEIVGGAEALRG